MLGKGINFLTSSQNFEKIGSPLLVLTNLVLLIDWLLF